jgi:glycosyltransferase involved in cell wall biosynthesis
MTIAFVHNNKAFLPETEAYCRFFNRVGITCEVTDKDNIGLIHRNVEWRLMGLDLTKPKEGILKIHEYTSSSVPPGRFWKNWSKAFVNAQPDFRLFLNEYVRKCFSFHDSIPFGYRDMGIPGDWLTKSEEAPEKMYDFVYLGDMSAFREPERLLNIFATGTMRGYSLLMIGKNYDNLKEIYKSYSNIVFVGPLPQPTIPNWLRKARFAINFIIDKEPINSQTSTKFLEYAACDLPVVTTQYKWVNGFQRQYGGEYFFLNKDLSNFTWENVQGATYRSPDLSSWTWEEQIRKSGVVEFLGLHYPDELGPLIKVEGN